MSERTLLTTMNFRRSFFLRAAGGTLPPGAYTVETVEDLIEGVSFEAYRRVATTIFLPAGSTPGNATQMATIDPTELADAYRRDGID